MTLPELAPPTAKTLTPAELSRRVEALSRLLEATQSLAATVSPQAALPEIASDASQAIGCERASLFQFDAATGELHTTFTTELEIGEIRRPLSSGVAGWAARERQVACVSQPEDDPRWDREIDRITGFQTRNILAVPLISPQDDRLLGVLQLLNKRDGDFTDFDRQLAEAFSQHAAIALDRVRNVQSLRERESLEASLQVARDVQRRFMSAPRPQIPGYDVALWWAANEVVGGDYAEVLPLCDGRFGLIVADVSGHGLGPSLLMATARAILRTLAAEHSAPHELLRLLDRGLAPDLPLGRFITIALVALDPAQHAYQFANGGHAPAWHLHRASGEFSVLEPTGFPLGVVSDSQYPETAPEPVAPGDLLILCTDGLTESAPPGGPQFGEARLRETFREFVDLPLGELVRRVGEAVTTYHGGVQPPDDMTLLVARRL